MYKDYMEMNVEFRKMYEENINNMLQIIANDNTFTNTIRNLCTQALKNNWELYKKVNILNIIKNL